MTTETEVQLTSSELGTLWMTYIALSARLSVFDIFNDNTIDKEAKSIFNAYMVDGQNLKEKFLNIFNNKNVVIPLGFTEKEVVREAPPLFDDIFNIMQFRKAMKLNLGRSGVFAAMTYQKEVNDIFKRSFEISNKYYMMTTNYLSGKGVLARSPYVIMPKQVQFVEDKNYMSGFNVLSHRRSLDTIEVGYINESIESNVLTIQFLTGFAQVAKEIEVKKYFIEGKKLSEKIVAELSNILLQSDIQPSSKYAGKVTDSTQAPFSDKLMMYTNSLISSTTLGFTELGTAFSMRNDLPLKLAFVSKDTFEYAKKGSKIMIEHKWMEEPPQMKETNQIQR